MTRLRKKLENLAIAIKIRNINDVRKYAKNTILILAEINGEIFSEIEIEDDIVKKYTSTQIISEEEMHTLKKVFVKELNEFLLENNSILWQKMINKNS